MSSVWPGPIVNMAEDIQCRLVTFSAQLRMSSMRPGGTSISGGWGGGGLGPGLKFEGKIWGKVTKKKKNLRSSGITKGKNWDRGPDFGVISENQGAKYGVLNSYNC